MSRLHDAILECAVAEVKSRTAWDEPPAVYFLRVAGGVPVLRFAPLPDVIWRMGEAVEVLDRLADDAAAVSAAFRSAVPADLYGVAFRVETWSVITERGASMAEIRQVRRDAHAHRLRTRPDREEGRTITVVDRAGITYTANLRRSDGEVDAHILYRTVGTMTGAVVDALDRMITALLGVELGGRPDVPEAFWNDPTTGDS